MFFFFFSSRRRHTRWTGDWSSDVCSSDLVELVESSRRNQGQERGDQKHDGGLQIQKRHEREDQDRRQAGHDQLGQVLAEKWRSEERRVGKECRTGWAREQ